MKGNNPIKIMELIITGISLKKKSLREKILFNILHMHTVKTVTGLSGTAEH